MPTTPAMPLWLVVLSALLTPTVAVFASFLGYKQWRLAEVKMKLELLERRLVVYDAVQRFIGKNASGEKTAMADEMEYLQQTQRAKWLLSKDVEDYIKTVWHEAAKLHALQSVQDRFDDANAIRSWFIDQYKVVDRIFAADLRIGR